MNILVTGAAGFIGFHACRALIEAGHTVTGLDNLNDYYSVALKKDRLNILKQHEHFIFEHADIADAEKLNKLFSAKNFSHVINLAAQAGVRYSIKNPHSYITSNIVGFANILEACRHNNVAHLVYASSSSVYGLNSSMPFSTSDNVDHPISLYAASKKSNELMAHSYSYLYGLPTTGLRFFTVYGPWGRPDMALYIFTKAIFEGSPIPVFNNGELQRDFTYIDDIIQGLVAITDTIAIPDPQWTSATPDPASSCAPYKIYNIGNNRPVPLMHFIEILEECIGKKAQINFLPMQDGDVKATYADIDPIKQATGFAPYTELRTGIQAFVSWYKAYHNFS